MNQQIPIHCPYCNDLVDKNGFELNRVYKKHCQACKRDFVVELQCVKQYYVNKPLKKLNTSKGVN
jgi:transposase-like protein